MDHKECCCPTHAHKQSSSLVQRSIFSHISPRILNTVMLKVESCAMWPFKSKDTISHLISSWIPEPLKSTAQRFQEFGRNMFLSKSIEKLKTENEQLKLQLERLKAENELSEARFYRADVVFDPKTAHPRLEVSEDGESVWDTGNVAKVSNSEERFDSHTFMLARHGFSKGKHYWEVEVGQKKKWDMGVASESAPRKGKITLSPQNGYWVIGLDGGKGYWARTEPWTPLKMSGKPTRIGIFLNMSTESLSFYDVQNKSKLHTFKISHYGELYPFFSTGLVTAELESQPLKIPSWFKEGNIVEEE